MKFLTVVTITIVLEVCNGHLCMLNPPQRGSMIGINKAGANDCSLTVARCGGRQAKSPVLRFKRGATFTVTIQKNQDHYVKSKPGYFEVSIGEKELESGMTIMASLSRIQDAGEPSLTLYSVNVTIPTSLVTTGWFVIQTDYVTNNQNAPAHFYQCADIAVEE